ncbi:hypothetical protein BDR04DRAFT_1095320 [Suillus decipiens]|nr:hypothetical protein BDR04DRAFT_1095320 [Suillus decipiens]
MSILEASSLSRGSECISAARSTLSRSRSFVVIIPLALAAVLGYATYIAHRHDTPYRAPPTALDNRVAKLPGASFKI